jgi:hypothetical protein
MIDALRCLQCGASLPPALPTVASVACPSCGEINRIDGELLEHLHTHARRVGAVEREAAGAREAAQMAELTGSFGSRWAIAFVLSWLAAGLVMLGGSPLANAIALLLVAAPVLVLIVVSRRRLARLRARASRVGAATVPVCCPTCGGQSELPPEAGVSACRYCSGALAADAPTFAALIASAQQRLRGEQRIATEQRWRLAAKQGRAPRTDLVPYFVFGGLGGLWVIGSLAATFRVLVLGASTPAPTQLVLLDALALAIVLGVGTPLLVRRRRLQRWHAQVDALARELGASVSTELADLAEWLVAHWLGELPPGDIAGALGYVLLFADSPAAWAVSISPIAHDQVQPHLRVLVPGRAGARLSAIADSLAPLGCRTRIVDGGLIAELGAPITIAAARSIIAVLRR